jgi:hypothetical protein
MERDLVFVDVIGITGCGLVSVLVYLQSRSRTWLGITSPKLLVPFLKLSHRLASVCFRHT